ncbi:MAG: dihydrodipicolinate synthase family protein [Thermoplasmataceae archaeon]
MTEIIVPIITPFTVENRIDLNKLRKHADYLFNNGVDLLLLSGTTGLGPSLKFSEKLEILRIFEDIPEKVIMQVNSMDIEESVSLANTSKNMGIKAIASLPPYYYPRIPEEWYIRFFKKISSLYPTIAYNFPLTTNYDITPGLVKTVNSSGGNIIGIKDTTPDLAHMLNFKWEFGNEFKVYCGPDPLIYSAIRSGLDGAVPGTGNYAPKIIRSIIENIDSFTGLEYQRKLTSIAKLAQRYGQWSANYNLVNIIGEYDVGLPRPPIFPLEKDQEIKLKDDYYKIIKEGD